MGITDADDYSIKLAGQALCPCVFLGYGTKNGAAAGCPLCNGEGHMARQEYAAMYERYCRERQGSGEFELAMPPTMPVTSMPMGLHEALLAGGGAMQTVDHVTWWVVPEPLGLFQLSVKPYEPRPIAITQPTDLGRIYAATLCDITPHPHRRGWHAKPLGEVLHGR